MKHGRLEDVFPMNNEDFHGFSIAMLVYQKVCLENTLAVGVRWIPLWFAASGRDLNDAQLDKYYLLEQ